MTIFLCGQSAVLGDDTCVCGFWLHGVVHGGFEGPHGWRYCSLECIDDQLDFQARNHTNDHHGTRDLLCDCAEFCAPAGLPTAAMLQEYADYVASIKGTALDPGTGLQRVIE